ncbi:MAG: GNAT family N-acetyltransferase [Candidatus Caccovivens sp.]
MSNNKVELVIPTKKDLWFKKEIKEDPNTMDYNAGYDLTFKGYNREDGTIQTDIKELEEVWSKRWIDNEPTNFYYYIKSNDKFVGEIYAKFDNKRNSYEIGIVIKGEHRGKGIATPAIKLLCEKLKSYGVKSIYHELPMSRKRAIKSDINNGFVVIKENIDGMKKFGEVEKLVYLEKYL